MPSKLLAIYLNDHLMGATGGVELAKRAVANNGDSQYGEVLSELATEIEADRNSLLELMSERGVARDRLKVAAGWAGERAGRLKLNGALTGYSPLSRLVEIEGLSLGVAGKLQLWENLRASFGDSIGSVDLVELAERARGQRARLDALRATAAAEALRN